MSSAESSIGVIGGGYVGLVSGACFAALGFDVTIVEADATKLQALRANRVPIYEPGLTELVEEGVEAGRLHFVSSVKEMFSASQVDVVFIAVGTPQRPDGSCNLDYVRTAALDVARGATREVVLVLKSTVPAGTARALLTTIRAELPNKKIAVVNNPEFLTEGNAVADFMRPARVVIGASESWAGEKVKALYESLLNNGHPLFVTDHETAELSKLASNLMLASRISLINQVSRLSDALGADIRQIESIMRSDPRIGPKYLYAGIGYGGSCFPKDVKSFVNQCEVAGVDASMAKSVDQFNDSQKAFFVPHIQKRFPKAAGTKV
ncbi:MAG: UDP-glucose/GDP-mannose dehydrogenase family protein, partial [Bdellovibrionales bacterium]|nr:UDP-glucose/GDP-mannose dehydrogenase family protein [Bdellovibrionales bacterium]